MPFDDPMIVQKISSFTMNRIKPFDQTHNAPDAKRAYNRALFDIVAQRYDLVTPLLSFFRDRAWKRSVITMLPESAGDGVIVDLACGTGDLCTLIAKRFPAAPVLAVDLSSEMLRQAQSRSGHTRILFTRQDMGCTGLKSGCTSTVTGGYALRNAPDIPGFIAGLHRIMVPGGCAVFLDFSRSPNPAVFAIQYVTLLVWGGLWGIIMHGNPNVYAYIAQSLKRFPDRTALHALFRSQGFTVDVSVLRLFGMMEVLKVKRDTEKKENNFLD